MMKEIRTVLKIILFVFIIVIPVFAPIYNNYVAKKTADNLADIPLPEKTEFVEKTYSARKLVGNGNGMQYFGAILVKSGLVLHELEEYYSGYADNEWECIVESQEAKEIRVIEHGELEFESEITGGGYYIVYSWGENHTIFNEFDLRGH